MKNTCRRCSCTQMKQWVCFACFSLLLLTNAAYGDERCTLFTGRTPPYSLAFSPDGRILAAGVSDRELVLWDHTKDMHLRTIGGFLGTPMAMAFSPDSKRAITVHSILVGGKPERLSIVEHWDIATGSKTKSIQLRGGSAYPAMSPDGRILLTHEGTKGEVVKAWEVEMRKHTALGGHARFASTVGVTADGALAATATSGGIVKLWELPSGKLRWTETMEDPIGNHLAFSADGKILALQTVRPNKVRLLDVQNGKEKGVAPLPCNPAMPLAFSPNGKYLAYCGGLGKVHLWEYGGTLAPLTFNFQRMGELAKAEVLTFSPDSRVLAVGGHLGGQGGVVRLYDLPKQEEKDKKRK